MRVMAYHNRYITQDEHTQYTHHYHVDIVNVHERCNNSAIIIYTGPRTGLLTLIHTY